MRSSQNQTPAGPASAWHRVGELAPTVLQKSDGIGLASDRILFRYRKSEPCCAKGENASIVSPDESGSHSERSRLHKFCHLFRSVAQKFHNRLDLFAVSSQSIVGNRRQSPDTQPSLASFRSRKYQASSSLNQPAQRVTHRHSSVVMARLVRAASTRVRAPIAAGTVVVA
jgi:hypothetical protein